MAEASPEQAQPLRRERKIPWVNLVLFVLTVISTFFVGYGWAATGESPPPWYGGWVFAVPLLSILLFHEFGHYIAARIHAVDASLPYFIPLPLVFGTFGAIIRMRGRIAKRNALLDIGAAGPLAGMLVALPVLIYGISLSEVKPQTPGNYILEGHSLLYKALLYLIHGPIPEGHDIFLHPVALAGWVGLFVTMLNLLPIGQLDGGHVAYALLGPRQDRFSRSILYVLPALGLAICGYFGVRGYAAGLRGEELLAEATVGINWIVWFVVLRVLHAFAGPKHPPVDPGELSPLRRATGVTCLLLLVLIFMPVPLRTVTYEPEDSAAISAGSRETGAAPGRLTTPPEFGDR